MLTNKDIDKLLAVLATKCDVQKLDERVQQVEDMQRKMHIGLDRLATAIEQQMLEYAS